MDISKIALVFTQKTDQEATVRVVVYARNGEVVEAETPLDATTIIVRFDDTQEVAA